VREEIMLEAVFWSTLATGALLIGMALAYRNVVGFRWTGLLLMLGFTVATGLSLAQLGN
jgi:hypothetical protein